MVKNAMGELLNYLKQRCNDNWLMGYNNHDFYELTLAYFQQFQAEKPTNIILAEADPFKFLAAFLATVASKCPIFLCNSDWKQQEWEQVFELVKPDLIIGNCIYPLSKTHIDTKHDKSLQYAASLIMIPTGGSSGKIRFAVHTWDTLNASVRGFNQYFDVKSINSFCTLPVYHVSGLMQFLRSFLTGGKFAIVPYKELKHNLLNSNIIPHQDYFISLVPTQLQFILQNNPEWLSQFYTVLLGGAKAWPSLLEQARQHKIRLAPTYGMTETASQIVTLKPDDFLNGNNSSGQVLPHAKIQFQDDKIITIQSESLFLGYYPILEAKKNIFITDDLGWFDDRNYLHIIGRNSQKIITGGENVFPSEVEAAILETQLVKDIVIIGLPDSLWGEVVTAIYVPQSNTITTEILKAAIKDKMSPYKHPKYWITVENLPRNQQGKLDYQQLKAMAINSLNIC